MVHFGCVYTRGAQQDKNEYRIQDELYRIQYSLAPIIVYGPKNRLIVKNIVKYREIRQLVNVIFKSPQYIYSGLFEEIQL